MISFRGLGTIQACQCTDLDIHEAHIVVIAQSVEHLPGMQRVVNYKLALVVSCPFCQLSKNYQDQYFQIVLWNVLIRYTFCILPHNYVFVVAVVVIVVVVFVSIVFDKRSREGLQRKFR